VLLVSTSAEFIWYKTKNRFIRLKKFYKVVLQRVNPLVP
jgi:hypothetical protein